MIKSYKVKKSIADTIIYTLLTVLGAIWVFPLFWIVMQSLRGEGGNYVPYIIPHNFTFKHFIDLFTEKVVFDYPRWFLNTLFVSICSCVISTFSVLMVSYTFSRLRFKTRKFFMNFGMILGMFPGFMTMIAIYYLLKLANLTGTLAALIICYSAGASLGYFISKGFFDTIPRALDEAATIDGATKNQIFWKIILPMSKPIVVYTVLTSFIGPWADFILVRIIMGDKTPNYTVAYGLYTMSNEKNIKKFYFQFCSGAVVVAIPITILFLNMQKYYVEGVTGGAVKG